MNPSFNHCIHLWTKSLLKVEKINLGRYGLAPAITLRGVNVDHNFLNACIQFWDPEAHVFRFGADWFEMCPLFEEFCAIIGCDPNGPLVRNELRVNYVRGFLNLFGFPHAKVGGMIADNKVVLSHLIDEFLEADLTNPDQMLYRRRAFVFCLVAGFLFNRDPGFGHLSLCVLISQMEKAHCIGGLILAETIRCLDRAALGFEEWTVSLIILQVYFSHFLFLFRFILFNVLIEKIN